jgi:hypothetical protein
MKALSRGAIGVRIDPIRSGLAAIASVLAVVGAIASNADHGMLGWELGTQAFPVDAFLAAAFVIVPSAGQWSRRRRILAAVAAFSMALPSFWLLVETGSRAACACVDPAGGYLMPTIEGVTAYDWVVISAIAIPVLMLASSLEVSRLVGRADRRPDPAAE